MNSEDIKLVTELIEKKDSDQLKEVIKDLHPADIAELCNELDAEDARFIYLLLDNETAADVLIEMDEDARKKFLEILPPETIPLEVMTINGPFFFLMESHCPLC